MNQKWPIWKPRSILSDNRYEVYQRPISQWASKVRPLKVVKVFQLTNFTSLSLSMDLFKSMLLANNATYTTQNFPNLIQSDCNQYRPTVLILFSYISVSWLNCSTNKNTLMFNTHFSSALIFDVHK